MRLRKDDPVYYKVKINTLIKDAFDNGLKVDVKIYNDKVGLMFKSDNGDRAEAVLNYNNI